MFRKMMMSAPLAGVLALSPASNQQVHAAQFSPPSDIGASSLLQPVRGGGGVIINGGGHSGGGFGGGHGGGFGAGRMGGFGGGPAFRGGMGYGGAGRSIGSMGSGRAGPFFREGGMSGGGRSFDRPGRMAVRSFDRMPNGGFEGSSNYIRRGDRAQFYRRDFSGNNGNRIASIHDRDRDRGDHDRRHHRLRRFSHFYFDGFGYGDYNYDYADSYYGDCESLRLQAVSSGSVYWWRRYRQCEDWY